MSKTGSSMMANKTKTKICKKYRRNNDKKSKNKSKRKNIKANNVQISSVIKLANKILSNMKGIPRCIRKILEKIDVNGANLLEQWLG